MTYVEFLNRIRIDKASKYLMQSIPVSDVCNLCGYESLPYFIKKFRSYYNCTPKEYATQFQMKGAPVSQSKKV